jgi:hypothetical protein
VLDVDLRQPLEDEGVPAPEDGVSRAGAPLAVAWARLRARSGRALIVVAGIAGATTMLVAVLGGGLVAQDRAVRNALAALPAGDRAFRVDAFGLPPGESYATADRRVRAVLGRLTSRPPVAATFYRQVEIGGPLVRLSGLDGLAGLVRLQSGRLPRGCTPARCEVLQLGPGTRREWRQDGIDLVRVGVATVPDAALFGPWLAPGLGTRLLASGADAFDRIPLLDGFYGVHSWIASIPPAQTHVWQIGGILARESRAQAALAAQGDVFELSGPDSSLLAARDTDHVAGQRLSLIGGELGVLLLGFALVAAVGLRRGIAAERRRLVQRGATTWQVLLGLGAEVGTIALAGVAAGLAGGAAAVAILARATGTPTGSVLAHGPGTRHGIVLIAALWAGATVALLAVASRGPDAPTRRVRVIDVLAVAAAAVAAAGFARGGLDASALATGNEATFLLLLPGLVCFAAAVAVARLLGPAMRAAERLARGGPLSLRLALLALARAPAGTAATAAFLVVALGLALFASAYRATLDRGARDQAAFAVPLDFSVTEGQRLVTPLEAAPLARYDRIAPGVRAYPIVRQTAEVPGSGTSVLSPTVLGVPPAALARLHWRRDDAGAPIATLARRVGADGPATLRTVPLPPGAAISLAATARGTPVDLDLAAENGVGDVTLLRLRPDGHGGLVAHTPRRPLALVGLEVSISEGEATGLAHKAAESTESAIPGGSIALGPLRAGGRTLTDWRGWVANGGTRAGRRLDYQFTTGQTVLLRRPQATDGRVLHVIASPAVAASAGPGGRLELDFDDVTVPAQVVGVARRFPDAGPPDSDFVVADESRLRVALEGGLPGTGQPIELWLSGPAAVGDVLAHAPFAPLVVSSRRSIEHSLATDPLARGVTITLEAAALVAAALAVLALWLALAGELADERGELADLEAQGVPPETLRASFRLRAVALVVVALAGGLALGLLVSRLAVALIRLTAGGAAPVPPLLFDPAWTLGALGLLGFALVAGVVVELTSRHAFRGETPGRPSWSLE